MHLPLWLPRKTVRTAWDVDTTRARQLGPTTRPVEQTVEDTWTWMRTAERPTLPANRPAPGLPADLEAALLVGR